MAGLETEGTQAEEEDAVLNQNRETEGQALEEGVFEQSLGTAQESHHGCYNEGQEVNKGTHT